MTKKITSLLISLTLVLCTVLSMSMPASAAMMGDLDDDGKITSNDALYILQYSVNNRTLVSSKLKIADVNGDGKVNSTDALLILQYSVGKITKFPSDPLKEVFSGFYWNEETGEITTADGTGLLGYGYNTKDKVFITVKDSWQRNFGFIEIYDDAAAYATMHYDTSRIYFDYDGKEWMIQLWKGQYGPVFVGAEIGVYTRLPGQTDTTMYICAEDDDMLPMSFELFREDSFLFKRSEQVHWWLTGFVPGMLPKFGTTPDGPQELSMTSHITFKDAEMTNAFVEGLKDLDYVQHNTTRTRRDITFIKGRNFTVKGNTVTFTWK